MKQNCKVHVEKKPSGTRVVNASPFSIQNKPFQRKIEH